MRSFGIGPFGFRGRRGTVAAGPPSLRGLTGSFTLAEDAAAGSVAGAIGNRSTGSTLSLFDDAGGRVAIDGVNVVRGATALDYETATSHSFTVRETLAEASNSPRDTVFTLTVTNALEVTLAELGGAFSLAENAAADAIAGALTGVSSGSSLALVDDAGGRVALSGANIVRGATALDYESATSHAFTVRETHPDSGNSPRDTVLSLTVTNISEAATLGALALDDTSIPEDASATINITGSTIGSTLSLLSGSLPEGMTLDSLTMAIVGTPTTPGTYNFTLRETLADSPNSPNDTALSIEVTAAAGAEFYKTATLTGAAPAGHPVAIQVWNYEPAITGFGTASVLGTNVGAMQGVAASTAYFFTSSGTSAAPANNRHIRTYNTSWALQHTKDTALDFASHNQVNGLFYDASASKLYASANNFNTTPSAGWILEYDVAGDGSLTFVSAHSVGNIWSEATVKYDGSWWVVGHDKHEIHQYDLTWALVQIHTLPGTNPFQAPNGELYQGIVFVGDVAIVNRHSGHLDSPRADSYRWTGSGFIAEFLDLSPPQYCTQGIHLSADGASILWARRNLNDSTAAADVVSTPIVNSYEGVGLEGRALADFSDVRITDGSAEVAAWMEHYIDGRTAWLHFALPAEIVTSADFRVYYGSGAAATRAAASSVTLKINDFESGRDDFTNNYNTGSAASSAGTGLLGTAGLTVSSPGTGDGVYSDDNDFMTTGLRKLTGWVKHVSGQAGTTPTSVWFMQTVSGTTRRRGAIRFNSTDAEALSNGVVQAPFATGFTADTWRRFQVEFDYANSDFGLKVWDGQGVLRGSTARTAYSTDDGTRTYKDVMLFRAMTADRIFSQSLLATEPSWGAWSVEASTAESGATAPVLTVTSAAGTNPPSWSSEYSDLIIGTDYICCRWRVNGGAWTNETNVLFDSDFYMDYGVDGASYPWPLFAAATFNTGELVEVQEGILRGGATAWSNTLSDTMA